MSSQPTSESNSEVAPVSEPTALSEDWTAVILGFAVVLIAVIVSLTAIPEGLNWGSERPGEGSMATEYKWTSPLKSYLGESYLGGLMAWRSDPRASLIHTGFEPAKEGDKGKSVWQGILGAGLAVLIMGAVAQLIRRKPLGPFLMAFVPLYGLVVLSYFLAAQRNIKDYNLEYALWALLVGMLISNTIGLPKWLKPAVQGELYIKMGLVLMGAGVLFGKLLALGIPGIAVAWVVTPIVLISTFIFGQKVLKIESPSLNMVISADMSVCGVSAAIATAAACKAKKNELSLAIGLSLSFTVVMMIVLPFVINFLQIDPVVGGAWMGGTIDATGAVAAASEMLPKVENASGIQPSDAAVTIKMIQNILIGVTAFGVAVFWASYMERDSDGKSKVGIGEIWKRFPKFVIGFIGLSILMSILAASSYFGDLLVESVVNGMTKDIRKWLFCFAFVCIGLETDFRQLMPYFRTGKPAVLYVVGQSLNLLLTFLMAYLMFGLLGEYWNLA